MRTQYFFHCAVVVSVVAAACSEDASNGKSSNAGSGPVATGGLVGTGGAPATGGTAGGGKATTGGMGTGAGPTGGAAVTGGATATGGTPGGAGKSNTGGSATGGSTIGGATGGGGAAPVAGSGGKGGGATGTGGGSGGGSSNAKGPCDIYEAATPSTPCVAAYSTIRRIKAAYTGPLFQVRSGSNAMNTGSGGETHDIMQSPDGFALASTVDEACGGTTCTVSLLYDQSGKGNHLPVAKGGRTDGGMYAHLDDFETEIVSQAALNVGGNRVYSLYMEARQGYRQTKAGDGVPLNQESQGLYMLADGTHYGTACCWDFGNVSPDPTRYGVMNTLLFGVAYWGRGAGSGPWYMADYEAGVWAGGTNPGDPGWGALTGEHPPNPMNPSLRVKYALGFLKTNENDWSLRMADAGTATTVTTAYAGGLPKDMHNEGAIVIGVGGDNSNNSWGTFYEGAVLAGFPSDATEQAILDNIKAASYGN